MGFDHHFSNASHSLGEEGISPPILRCCRTDAFSHTSANIEHRSASAFHSTLQRDIPILPSFPVSKEIFCLHIPHAAKAGDIIFPLGLLESTGPWKEAQDG